MKAFVTIFLLCVGTGCFSQTDTSARGKLINRPVCYETLANADFDIELKFEYPPLTSKGEGLRLIKWTTKVLCGGWQAEALGNSWNGFKQLVRPNKRMIFKGDSLFVYRNERLVRATTFHFVRTSDDTLPSIWTKLAFGDSSERWMLSFIQPGGHVPWHGTATKLYLFFSTKPDCICGCPEELYSQEVSSDADRY